MLEMEKRERHLCDCFLSFSDSRTPLSFRLTSSDKRRGRGREASIEDSLFLYFGMEKYKDILVRAFLNISGHLEERQDGQVTLRNR